MVHTTFFFLPLERAPAWFLLGSFHGHLCLALTHRRICVSHQNVLLVLVFFPSFARVVHPFFHHARLSRVNQYPYLRISYQCRFAWPFRALRHLDSPACPCPPVPTRCPDPHRLLPPSRSGSSSAAPRTGTTSYHRSDTHGNSSATNTPTSPTVPALVYIPEDGVGWEKDESSEAQCLPSLFPHALLPLLTSRVPPLAAYRRSSYAG
ncbi:hypothetical protein BGY98DRAFT_751886 [Russula aff. rugulosa BPL654]|nr:hypothetical protein BGY98DRAFT_751886 [Russula aff. rugulosa BPL654]